MSHLDRLSERYHLDKSTDVWVPHQTEEFKYSDGPVEQRIARIVNHTADVSCDSESLYVQANDWATRYHFSPARANLLRPVESKLKGRVLEIGAGCGAITRYLGELHGEVYAIEGSFDRAKIARDRCRDLSNVKIICDNATNFSHTEKFDAVTLIGVLEYSRKYVSGSDPIETMLSFCKSHLKDDGCLIIAIENQLGLKYFAGAPEDHVGQAFFGINDNYGDKTVVTFGKKELSQRLAAAGFADVSFSYPFPDYKMPRLVLTEEGVAGPTDFIENLSGRIGAPFQNRGYKRTLSEEASASVLARNGLLGDLANSFLICAQPRLQDRPDTQSSKTLAYIYSTQQGKAFAKETVITQAQGVFEVARRRLFPHLLPSKGSLSQRLCDKPMIRGPLYSNSLHRIVNTPGWSDAQVVDWARPWVNYLKAKITKSGSVDLPNVPGNLVDCIPINMVRQSNGAFECFDLEWQISQDIPLAWVILRGIFHCIGTLQSVALPEAGTSLMLVQLAGKVLNDNGLGLTVEEFKSVWKLETMFFSANELALLVQLHVRGDHVVQQAPVKSHTAPQKPQNTNNAPSHVTNSSKEEKEDNDTLRELTLFDDHEPNAQMKTTSPN